MVAQPPARLPSTRELPCSDDTPVDNEEQNLLPNLLLLSLASIWSDRLDWFFAVDMAVYHTTGVNPRVPVVPDAFLSMGVKRQREDLPRGRLSYAVWEEDDTVPTLAVELVSQTPGGEYGKKMEIYRRLGVLYYVIYNPLYWQRDRHQPFEVYRLEDGADERQYQLQIGEPFWMPEVGIGIGRARQFVGQIEREVLLWHNEDGEGYLLPEEEIKRMKVQRDEAEQRVQAAEQRIQAAEQEKSRLADYLRSRGIDPDSI